MLRFIKIEAALAISMGPSKAATVFDGCHNYSVLQLATPIFTANRYTSVEEYAPITEPDG